MRMYDLISKKRGGGELDQNELAHLVSGYVAGTIPDYQMSAFLMAVYFQGMTDRETTEMTWQVARSGDMIDLSRIEGIKVDKHSTGGVGDKTTLIIAPIVAACGAKVAKISGRGLGHTGGTVDKLESIPGLRTSFTVDEFTAIVNKTGLSVIGQSGDIAPADKKLYALRDVTATVDSIPLIAVSIMSKKLAAGSDCILLDVKTGSGAFMKTTGDAIALAEKMVAIGEGAGKRTMAFVTDMDVPLGHNIGNALEVIEAIETLQGKGPDDLTEVCIKLAANMLVLAGKGSEETCIALAKAAIQNGQALTRLAQMVEAQGGDPSYIYQPEKFEKAPFSQQVLAPKSGYITQMNTEMCGIASAMLGAGRETKDSELDFSAGMILGAKTGEKVVAGQVLATLFACDENLFSAAEAKYQSAITISPENIAPAPLIFAKIFDGHVEQYVPDLGKDA